MERLDAREREVGIRAWVMVAFEAMLCCETDVGGDDLEGGDDELGVGACADGGSVGASLLVESGELEATLGATGSELGLSAAEV